MLLISFIIINTIKKHIVLFYKHPTIEISIECVTSGTLLKEIPKHNATYQQQNIKIPVQLKYDHKGVSTGFIWLAFDRNVPDPPARVVEPVRVGPYELREVSTAPSSINIWISLITVK